MPITVLDLFDAQVARTPDAVALAGDGRTWTYADLAARSGRLARRLAGAGCGPDRLVAILLDRSPELVTAVLAVLRSGAGYVPVSVDDPPDRQRLVLADSEPVLVVTDTARAGGVAAAGVDPRRVLIVDAAGTGEAPHDAPADGWDDRLRSRPLHDGDVAYVIYTSGSTGRPKGVVVEHRALAAYLDHVCTHYPAVAGRTLLHSSVSFDMAVTSLFGPLLQGGTVVVTGLDRVPAGAPRPTLLKVTPSHLALMPALPAACAPLDQLVVGGEALFGTQLAQWRREHPEVTVVNEYGPTEATVGCCVYVVRPGEPLDPGAVPIGRPTAGTRLHVLDEHRRPVDPGCPGELYIAGTQLARGYLNAPELTGQRFLSDPFGPPGSRMYRTGDLVRQRPDGNLEFLGRIDDQVKVRGYRVEPGEAAAVLARSELVAQAAVVAVDAGPDGQRLVGYVVTAPGQRFDPQRLRQHMAGSLPEYLVPSDLVEVAELPLTANGKLDRARLPQPPDRPGGAGEPAAAGSPQALLCRFVGEIVGVPDVGVDDDFVALGGSSIAAARLVTRARRAGLEIGLMDVLRKRTVRLMLEGVS